MGVTVQWEDEAKTRLRYIYKGQWDWCDFYATMTAANTLLDETSHKVGIIIDMGSNTMLPKGTLTHISSLGQKAHANVDITILVGANRLVHAIYELFQNLLLTSTERFLHVPTLEDAHAVFDWHLALKKQAETVKSTAATCPGTQVE